jgi:hypothetical protein
MACVSPSTRYLVTFLGWILAGLSMAQGPPQTPAPSELSSLATARYDLASKQYDETWTYYQQARIDSYQVYVWSKLMLDSHLEIAAEKAERQKALGEHLARMKKLEVLIKKVRRLGFGRSYDVGASEYYVREAEFWVARLKSAK